MFRTNFNEEEKLWFNLSTPPLYNSNVSLGQLMLNALSIHGSKIAQICDDTGIKMGFDEILTKTIRAAQNLKKRGYHAKQVFGFLTRNSDNLTPIMLASFCLGCPVNPLFPLFSSDDIAYSFKKTKPSLIFCDVDFYHTVVKTMHELGSNVEVFTFCGQTGDSIPVEKLFEQTGVEGKYVPTNVDGINDDAVIISSSGTTGRSKNVKLSHAAMINAIAERHSLNTDDVMFAFCLPFWTTGIISMTSGILNGATRVITKHNFIPELQLKIIERYKVTFLWNVPYEMHSTVTNELAETTDLSSIKTIQVAGAKLSSDTKIKMKQIWPNITLIIGYGITEIGGAVAANRNGYDNNSVGYLIKGCTCKIINENGHRCGVGVVGEICLKYTTFQCNGYLDEVDANEQSFDHEGFFLTGDIGHFSENGYLYILDRKKELIKYNNLTISPSDIENFLIKFAKIKSVAIVGIPNKKTEELPAAVVVRNDNADLTEHEIHKMVSDEFPDFMMLRGGVYFVDSLPKTPNGKLKRQAIRELAIECIKKTGVDIP